MYEDLTLSQVVAAGEAALIVSFVLGVVLHEAGHAVAAWLAGLDLRLVSVGHGRALLHVRRRRVVFVLRWLPLSGLVAIAVRPGMSRYGYAAMVAAGPAVNVVLLGVAIGLDQAAPYYDAILVAAGVAQSAIVLLTLTPFKHKARGGVRASDGLQLWRQLAGRPPDRFATQYAAVMGLVHTAGSALPPPSPSAPDLIYEIVRSDRMVDAWALRDAAASVRALLAPGRLNAAERAVGLEFLVSGEVLFGETGVSAGELDAWSAEACTLAPGVATTLTRAGVLATTGHGEQATELLLSLPEGGKPIVALFRYWLHMAQAARAQGLDDVTARALGAARKAAGAKVSQRRLMQSILARAERTSPLAVTLPGTMAAAREGEAAQRHDEPAA